MIHINKKLIPGGYFYVAVSGGVDSIAAAHLISRMYKGWVKICHFNHNTRSRNNVMQKAVEWFCEDNNLEFVTEKCIHEKDVKFSENYLREKRMKFFSSLNKDIVLCQHLNDAVESMVMRFLVGEHSEYVPIPEKTFLGIGDSSWIKDEIRTGFYIHRPFLTTRKDDFIVYAENNDLMKYVVDDETNENNSYRRNWVRNELLPQLTAFGLERITKRRYYQ